MRCRAGYTDDAQTWQEVDAVQLLGLVLLGLAGLAVASVLLGYLRSGAPPVPSTRAERADVVAMLREASLPDAARIYELGCGWGGLARALARAFPAARVVGIERSPVPWLVAWLRARTLPNLEVRFQNFLLTPLDDADALACYLMIRPMLPLAAKLDRELQAGTPVVALTFWFRDRLPEARRGTPGLRGDVARYRWPARSAEND